MGGCCCHVESPGCSGGGEERSGLLVENAKASTQEGRALLAGTCGPQRDGEAKVNRDNNVQAREGVRAAEVKSRPDVRETRNGPQTAPAPTPPPRKIPENPPSAPDGTITGGAADGAHADRPWCAFISPAKELSTPNSSAAEAQTRVGVPDIGAAKARPVCSENHTEIKATAERVKASAPDGGGDNDDHDEDPGAGPVEAEACGQVPGVPQVLSQPDTRLPPVAVVRQEGDGTALSCAGDEDSQPEVSSGYQRPGPDPEHVGTCDLSASSSEPELRGLDRGAGDGASSRLEPEASAQEEGGGESLKADQETKTDLPCVNTSSSENIRLEEVVPTGQEGDKDVLEAEENEEEVRNVPARSQAGNEAEVQEGTGEEERPAGSPVNCADGLLVPEGGDEDDLENSDEDLYRGAEELSASQALGVEDRCSLAPAMDILSYSEREWRGNTAKSALIRKGYAEMSGKFGGLRRVRGDNYCALRATLFQVLTHSTQLPSWLQDGDVTTLPDQLEAQEGLISGWSFPGECLQGDGRGDAILQMKGYTELLRAKWRAAVGCSSAVERQRLCERLFRGGEEELGLLEALKLLMLARALELHGRMRAAGDVPLFCWLLFARDSSGCPRAFLSNHLSHVGLSAGLEQVEMFLLGYTLECTLQVYRLYKADTEEFVTYYPDDHKDDWPSVCLVTEDDRHYNVPIVEAAEGAEPDWSGRVAPAEE